MEALHVDLKDKSYQILFRTDFSGLSAELERLSVGKKLLLVTDSNVEPLWSNAVLEQLSGFDTELCVLPAGEKHKGMDGILKICAACVAHGMDRDSAILALGGGVVGDMAGFAAAIYMRGISFVQIPTTLLSQSDSSVGGKTGIDFMDGKNLLGAFHQPKLVYMNIMTLSTLPKREFISGMGEVIKHGMIRDADFFEFLRIHAEEIKRLDPEIMIKTVRRNCEIKASVVSVDEKEHGLRAILNFGHTIGHAVESACNFKRTHGECVAVGMCAASLIAKNRGMLPEEELSCLTELLALYGFETKIDLPDQSVILSFMKNDKKNHNGKNTFILPEKIGRVIRTDDVTGEEIRNALQFISK